jgi:hypothetical protein
MRNSTQPITALGLVGGPAPAVCSAQLSVFSCRGGWDEAEMSSKVWVYKVGEGMGMGERRYWILLELLSERVCFLCEFFERHAVIYDCAKSRDLFCFS